MRADQIAPHQIEKVVDQIDKELRLIEELDYGGYFLTMHEIVTFCRARGILCQGRGSAANSAVCFVLGVTAVDPMRVDLLFERNGKREGAKVTLVPEGGVGFGGRSWDDRLPGYWNKPTYKLAILGVEYHWSRDLEVRSISGEGPKALEWSLRSGLEYACTNVITGT